MTSRITAVALASICLAGGAHAAQPIAGHWLTADGSAIVAVGPCGTTTCGRIAKVLKAKPGAPSVDASNPDVTLRTRPIVGLPILSGFADKGKDWRGKIYDPRNGKTYKSIVARGPDGVLNVKGCIAFFCQNQVWKAAR